MIATGIKQPKADLQSLQESVVGVFKAAQEGWGFTTKALLSENVDW